MIGRVNAVVPNDPWSGASPKAKTPPSLANPQYPPELAGAAEATDGLASTGELDTTSAATAMKVPSKPANIRVEKVLCDIRREVLSSASEIRSTSTQGSNNA